MSIVKYEDIGDFGKDVLKEVGSIGTGNAATSISAILGCDISIELPDIEVLGFGEAIEYLGDPEEPIIAVAVELDGEVHGLMMFLMRIEFANKMIKAATGIEIDSYSEIDEFASSAITEIGNIMISSYVNAIISMTKLGVDLSVPAISINMLGGILNAPVATVGHETNKLMLISGKFIIGEEHHESSMLLIPTVKSLGTILERLGVNYDG